MAKLDGKTWLKYSISVWDDIEKSPEERHLDHPAMYPSALVRRLLEAYFPANGQWVLDPFLGSGSTLVAARDQGLCGIGVEVVEPFAELARKRIQEQPSLFHRPEVKVWKNEPVPVSFLAGDQQRFGIVVADARRLSLLLYPTSMDMMVTSPPYWHIHTRKRTADRKTERPYSDIAEDLGNVPDYSAFLSELQKVFRATWIVLKPDAPAVVNVMDIRVGSQFVAYHMDIASLMAECGFVLQNIIIWDRRRDYNNLRPLGYPHRFVVNKVHEYLLISRRLERLS